MPAEHKRKHNPALTKNAISLRKSMTREERHLWYDFLRDYPTRFLRQKVIDGYIVDFYCHAARLVIEIDGSQHYEERGLLSDKIRTERIEKRGLWVLRIPNNAVSTNFAGVCELIDHVVTTTAGAKEKSPSPADTGQPPLGKGAKEEGIGMKTVELYTDGACSGNPGPGGWGVVLRYNGHERELSGGEEMTTNNRMELTAVIQGLLALKESCVVELWSDSKYVIDALEKGWAWGWRRKGWIKSDKKPALNPDLWTMLLDLTCQHEMHYHWVKGHADNEYNNRCDKLAVAEREKFT